MNLSERMTFARSLDKKNEGETFDTTISQISSETKKTRRPFSQIIQDVKFIRKEWGNTISRLMYAGIVSSVYADGDCEKH